MTRRLATSAAGVAASEDIKRPCTCGPNGHCALSCPNRPKAPRAAPEAAIQRAIIDRLRWHGVLVMHVPNAGKRSAIAGRRLKGEGMRPGWPDLACYQHGRHALLEVKAPKGRVSEAQRECHGELLRHAFPVAVVTSQDEAVEVLRARGFAL
jgi:hypothetical protein